MKISLILFFFYSQVFGSRKLNNDEMIQLNKEGFVLCKNLVNNEDLDFLIQEGKNTIKRSSLFNATTYTKIEFDTIHRNNRLKNITRNLPAKQIMENNKFSSIFGGKTRVLKDAFFSLSPGLPECGLHVDDPYFWPSPLYNLGHEGINIWIALSEYKKKYGGGLAVVKSSRKSKYFNKARKFIRTKDNNDIFMTCNLSKLDPKANKEFEKNMVTFDMNPGDAIIHNRWCFHKGDNFTNLGIQEFKEPLMRYSIRYMPENSYYLNTEKKLKNHDEMFPIVY